LHRLKTNKHFGATSQPMRPDRRNL